MPPQDQCPKCRELTFHRDGGGRTCSDPECGYTIVPSYGKGKGSYCHVCDRQTMHELNGVKICSNCGAKAY